MVRTQIKQLLAQQGVRKEHLSFTSRLRHNLGLEGDDAVEFFSTLATRFGTDLTVLEEDWSSYFGPDGLSIEPVAVIAACVAIIGAVAMLAGLPGVGAIALAAAVIGVPRVSSAASFSASAALAEWVPSSAPARVPAPGMRFHITPIGDCLQIPDPKAASMARRGRIHSPRSEPFVQSPNQTPLLRLDQSSVEDLNAALRVYRRLPLELLLFLVVLAGSLILLPMLSTAMSPPYGVCLFGMGLTEYGLMLLLAALYGLFQWRGRQVAQALNDPGMLAAPVAGLLSGQSVIAERANAMDMEWSDFFGPLRPRRKR